MPAIFERQASGVSVCSESGEQLLHGRFAFAEDDEVGAGFEVLLSVGAGLGAADDDRPSGFAGNTR